MNNIFIALFISAITCSYLITNAQPESRPELIATLASGELNLDGFLDEPDWAIANIVEEFKTIEPVEGGTPSGQTILRVLVNPKFLAIGIECLDDSPEGIISYSKLRDSDFDDEDHIRIVIDPFLDGQSGLIFAVNANGARYDALVSNRGESENDDWDAIWEARARIHQTGWTIEIKIPIQSFSFDKSLDSWGFNVERRIQRFQETIRWANVHRDQWFIQTSRAGLLKGFPEFDFGMGLNIRPSLIVDWDKEADKKVHSSFDPSLDVSQRIGSNVLATATVNTDFAESEVDTRQTNLTRFPLFFPEKRAFFLEGADIFEFGFGLRQDIVPFFSRRIGLYAEREVPISAGGKINGRVGKSSFGGLVMRTHELEDGEVIISGSTLGVIRVKQNILKESSIGFIGTFGDPENKEGGSTAGVDFTYQTTRFQGNKNFLIGMSGMYADRPDLTGDHSAWTFKVDYPNDIWDLSLTHFRIGDAFEPAMGFVPRTGIHSWRLGMTYAPRPSLNWLRQMRNQLVLSYIENWDGDWESYRIFTAPINWRLESGDRVEINYAPTGEKLIEPFEIAKGILIPAGSYHFQRYRLEWELAAKRKVSGQLTWWFGSFYDGHLHELEGRINVNPSSTLNFEFVGTHNVGRLPHGDFDQTLAGFRVRFNASPDLQLNSFIQYDTDTKSLGINTRIHWIFHPQGDLFIVYNHNTFNGMERWELVNQQVLVKGRYNFRL